VFLAGVGYEKHVVAWRGGFKKTRGRGPCAQARAAEHADGPSRMEWMDTPVSLRRARIVGMALARA
jgi:hypothetical protein